MLVDVCYRGPSLFCRLRASMGLKHRDLVRSSFRLFHGQREHGLGASFAGFGMPQPSRSFPQCSYAIISKPAQTAQSLQYSVLNHSIPRKPMTRHPTFLSMCALSPGQLPSRSPPKLCRLPTPRLVSNRRNTPPPHPSKETYSPASSGAHLAKYGLGFRGSGPSLGFRQLCRPYFR